MIGNMASRQSDTTLYLEDLSPGQSFQSTGRTITEADVTAFAGLSGDFNPIHLDAEFARESIYGQRVVYGVLGLAMATGFVYQLGIFTRSTSAQLAIRDWTYHAPLFINDTISLTLIIESVRPSTSRPGLGVVTRRLELRNQRAEVVQTGYIDLLVRCRPDASLGER